MVYTIKMTRKYTGLPDYTICKLECQWWLADGSAGFDQVPQEQWFWRMLIRTPEAVTGDDLCEAQGKLQAKGKTLTVREVTLESLSEGECVQMLHVGPYEQEGKTFKQMEAYAQERGLHFHGRPHEIYLSDCRRVPPERLKTILRHPVC